jgi:long-chain acyl-CoA synthetase
MSGGDFPWLKHYPAGIDYKAPIPEAPLYRLIDDAATQFGDRPAFDFLGKHYTYSALGRLVDRAAAGFRRIGVAKGSHVGLILPNCPYYPIAFFGVLKAGGTVVNFNPLYTEKEIAAQMNDSGVTVMVTLDIKQIFSKVENEFGRTRLETIVICPMTGILPFPKNLLYPIAKRKDIATPAGKGKYVTFGALTRDDGQKFIPAQIDPRTDIALLQYTGGTTGVPKGAMLTHANVYANTVQSTLWLQGVKPGQERMLAVIPFFHVFAMTAALTVAIYIGAEIIALPRFELVPVLKTIQARKPTIFPAVPTIYNAIMHHPDRADYDLSSIKFCFSGGAPLPVEVKEAFERVTGCTLIEGYGLSETSPVATGNPVHGDNKPGSIGMPVPRTVIEIISLEDRLTPVPVGEKGEICISGPQVMAGYWNQPEETAVAMQGGRFHTGDIGYMDEDGYTFIVDRLKDIVIAGGFKIYPRHIEEAVYQHEGVEECIAAGIPDEYRGQTVKLWVKPREGVNLTEAALKTFLENHLSAIEMPKMIEIRETALPKTLIGKLSRKAILEEEAAKSKKT